MGPAHHDHKPGSTPSPKECFKGGLQGGPHPRCQLAMIRNPKPEKLFYLPGWSSRAINSIVLLFFTPHNNNNNTIWGGSVLTCEEPPPHSGELKHALPQAGGPTQSQLSRPVSSGHHISMEYRLRRKQLNSDTNASKKKNWKIYRKKEKKKLFSSEK